MKLILQEKSFFIVAIFFFLLSLTACTAKNKQEKIEEKIEEKPITNKTLKVDYDVVIVGAGLAGLDATMRLNSLNTLLLEKNSYLGGRVDTKEKKGIPYELGALFINNLKILPFATAHFKFIREPSMVGFFRKKKLWLAPSLFSSMKTYPPLSKDIETLEEIKRGSLTDITTLSNEGQLILKSFFNTINPADLKEYMPKMVRYAFSTFRTDHIDYGAKRIIEVYEKKIKGPIITGAEVFSVKDKGDYVEVLYKQNGKSFTVTSKAAIVTTPATIAHRIIEKKAPRSEEFLSAVRYGSGIAVVVALEKGITPNFRYIATPEYPFSVIYQTNTPKEDVTILTAYYLNKETHELAKTTDKTIIADTIKQFVKMKLMKPTQTLFTDIKRWKDLGTIIDDKAYGRFSKNSLRPSKRVFLAGDYTMYAQKLAYGSVAAIRSGKEAATRLLSFLSSNSIKTKKKTISNTIKKKDLKKDYREPLMRCTVLSLSKKQPIYQKSVDIGDIAYYGTLLQASHDPQLAQYISSHTVNKLFEFHHGFGPSLLDSTLIIEGFMSSRIHPKVVQNALEALVERYYDPQKGAFRAVEKANAEYWNGVDIDSTAQAAYLLYLFDAKKYREIITKSADFIAAHQKKDGSWKSRWFPLKTYTTFYCSRLLQTDSKRYKKELTLTKKFISTLLQPSGSVDDSLMETAITVRMLNHLGYSSSQQQPLKLWLRSFSKNSATHLLYYWYKRKSNPVLISCIDRGEIAQAWKDLALLER
ncbi:FAD-dependent oxidoreductase [bacterium]|nr:FAD-dependent oxidoreductase [bacterium]